MMREYFRQREKYEWKQDGVSVQDKFASEWVVCCGQSRAAWISEELVGLESLEARKKGWGQMMRHFMFSDT